MNKQSSIIRDVKNATLFRGPVRQTTQEEAEGELEMLQAVAKTLHLATSDELTGIEDVLFPSIVCATVYKGGVENVEEVRAMGERKSIET